MSDKTWPEIWPAHWPQTIYATKQIRYDVRDMVEGFLSEQDTPIEMKDIIDVIFDCAVEDMYQITFGFDLVGVFEDENGDVLREEFLGNERLYDSGS